MIEFNDQLTLKFNYLKDKVVNYETPIKRCENFIELQKELFKEANKDIEILKSDLGRLNKKVELVDLQKMERKLFDDEKRINQNFQKVVEEVMGELKKELTATDNYLEKYLPVKMLNYIHDSMLIVLDKKEIKKMFEYLAVAYMQVEQLIANDDGKPSLVKNDFFLPSLDITQVNLMRSKYKVGGGAGNTENSSEFKGIGRNSSQKSYSQISGVTRGNDQHSDASKIGRMRTESVMRL